LVADKSERRYGIEGLSDREALVLKSMIRLLDHRTHHTWKYAPSNTELMVVSEKRRAAGKPVMCAQQVLTLGVASSNQLGFLCMPVHARELEAELNRLGALIVPVNRTAPVPSEAAGTTRPSGLEAQPMRMLRWPHSALLREPGRMRLATLMTGKQMTIEGLQRSSGESLAACSAFFEALQEANLLVPGHKAPSAPLAPLAIGPQAMLRPNASAPKNAAPTSLLARIRTRLGIQGSGASQQPSGT
jgi:hypothetical protein